MKLTNQLNTRFFTKAKKKTTTRRRHSDVRVSRVGYDLGPSVCKALTTEPRHIWDDLAISTRSNREIDWLLDELES